MAPPDFHRAEEDRGYAREDRRQKLGDGFGKPPIKSNSENGERTQIRY
jgi:hypothetical protein